MTFEFIFASILCVLNIIKKECNMHSRDGNTVNPEATPAAESTSNSEQPIGLFALLNGMMTPMQDIARKAESEEFKNKIEKDPIGEGFGLLIRLLGGMAAGMEQAAKQAEEKAEENAADKKASL